MGQEYIAMILLGSVGLAAAVLLYITAKRFNVTEDARIAEIEGILPGANCGACGRKGCHDFAVECCNTGKLDGMNCPGAGAEGMNRIARILGIAADKKNEKKAFLRCNGSSCNRLTKRTTSATSCMSAKMLAMPAGYCTWGCLGHGDCIAACRFDAMKWDKESNLPVIDKGKCVGCGACATICPQNIIFIREVERYTPVVIVQCSNRDKGGPARKMCAVACIGCGKCQRTCRHEAISVSDNVAIINPTLCIGCGECVEVCPTGAIQSQKPITL